MELRLEYMHMHMHMCMRVRMRMRMCMCMYRVPRAGVGRVGGLGRGWGEGETVKVRRAACGVRRAACG